MNLMNSQHQFLYPLDENPSQLLYSICSQPVWKSAIIVQGRERSIFFFQFLSLVSHILITSLCLADTAVGVKTPCYSMELPGVSAVAINSKTPRQKEGIYLKEFI